MSNKEYNTELQSRVSAYMSNHSLSQVQFAKKCGVSETAISQWRRSIYDAGSVESVESKITEFLRAEDAADDHAAQAAPYLPSTNYIPTSISEGVYDMIRYCQMVHGMVIVHGDAGIGKTKGAAKFVRENPNSSIYIQATPSCGTLIGILKMLSRELRMPESHNKLDLILAIRERLSGSNKVIIIDEAQHLKYAALEEIRTLADPSDITGEPGTGICLIGNTEVYSRMLGKQEARFAQLFSRIRMNRYYSTAKVLRDDICKLFPLLTEKGMKKEIDYLHGIGQSKWGVRGAVNVYNNAVNNQDVSFDGLSRVARNMGIGLI